MTYPELVSPSAHCLALRGEDHTLIRVLIELNFGVYCNFPKRMTYNHAQNSSEFLNEYSNTQSILRNIWTQKAAN